MAAGPSITIEPLPDLASIPPPDETGTTFEENAIQKALYYGARCEGWLFAEDSGLEVDALGGEPGVYSARFSGIDATDDKNNALLLERLAGTQDRAARYVCAIALVQGGVVRATFHGTVDGLIIDSARGSGGFSYDPLFFYPPFDKTFAEVDRERKQSVSHRGRALAKMLAWLTEHK